MKDRLRKHGRCRDKTKFKPLEEQARERQAKFKELDDFFQEARAYAKAKKAGAQGSATAPQVIPAWEAMMPYVAGELPVMVHADEIRQIKAAVNWAATNNLKMVLAGGRDAWMAADLLGAPAQIGELARGGVNVDMVLGLRLDRGLGSHGCRS